MRDHGFKILRDEIAHAYIGMRQVQEQYAQMLSLEWMVVRYTGWYTNWPWRSPKDVGRSEEQYTGAHIFWALRAV